jgi:hypothetical protein
MGHIRRSGLQRRLMPGMLLLLIACLVSGAVGELMGNISGKGDSSQKRVTFELERLRHTADRDRPKGRSEGGRN